MKTTVLSDGGWGTALAIVLCDNGHDVTLWGPFADYIEEMKKIRKNTRFLKGVELPDSLKLTADIQQAVGEAELVVLATPSQYMRGVLENLAKVHYRDDVVFADVAKGIEVSTCKRMCEIVEELLGKVRYAVLSGPSHAEEVARKVPTAVTAASEDAEAAKLVQKAFMNGYFRVYTSDDVVGAELGGSLKNILALAAGVIDGMELGDNTKAALMTRGIVEMARLGKALGGKAETFAGLSGVGDLMVTCMSRHSRNRHVGEELGKGRSLAEIQEEMGMVVAEGVATAKSARTLAKQIGVDVPIIEEVYLSLYEEKDPRRALHDLMTRDPKSEMENTGFDES